MAFKLKIIGAILALAGLLVSGFGWPYRMLDWGSIQVTLGAVLAMGGILLAALGFALQEVQAHIGRLMARAGQPQPQPPADVRDDQTVAVTAPPGAAVAEPASGAGGLAAAAAAGAAAMAGVAAITGTAAAESREAPPTTEPSFPPEGGLPKFDLDSFADEALARVSPVRDAAGSPIDELTARINEAVGDIDLLRQRVSATPEPEAVIDVAPDREADLDVADDDVVDPTLADDAAPPAPTDQDEDEDEPLPLAEAAVAEVEAPDGQADRPADDDADADSDDVAEGDMPERDEVTVADEPVTDEPDAERGDDTEQASEEAAAAPAAPVTSAEGIVGVHKVGASTFTMYADGTIRAETPEGAFGFHSVAELKAYLAGDKAIARSL